MYSVYRFIVIGKYKLSCFFIRCHAKSCQCPTILYERKQIALNICANLNAVPNVTAIKHDLGWFPMIIARIFQIISVHCIPLKKFSMLAGLADTVFELISGLFAYVILGQKNRPIYRTPLHFFCTVSMHYAICFIFYVLCLRLFRVQNATSEDRCMWGKEGRKEGRKERRKEGRKEGNLYVGKYT